MKYAKRSLGQNFLVDKNIIKKITNLVEIKNKDVVEIGPGKASLTNEIIKNKPRTLSLIEKDDNFAEILRLRFLKNKDIRVFNQDFLDFDFKNLNKKKLIIFGNLPYNVSSQIFVKILKIKNWPPNYTDLILMFQKELGEKILGKFQSKNYGRLSILSHYKLLSVKKFFVSANCFFPKPKVTSIVIHFKPKKQLSFRIKDLSKLERITNILFSNKRKMINKNISKILKKGDIKKIVDLNLNSRPEELKPDIYYKLAEFIEKDK